MSKDYGTVEWYAEQFSDILADVSTEGPLAGNADIILEGFYQALYSWCDYHAAQSEAYSDMHLKLKETLGK